MIMIRNHFLGEHTTHIGVGIHNASVPPATEREAGVIIISAAHHAALLELPVDDLRRVRLGSFEVTDLGAVGPDGRLTVAQQALVRAARVSTYRTPMAQRIA